MSTTYSLTIGYLSGDAFEGTREEAWQALVNTVEALRNDGPRIAEEARRLNAPEACGNGCCTLLEIALAFAHPEMVTVSHTERRIRHYASGDRSFKYYVQQAFNRLVLEDMHRQGIEVNLNVY